MATKQKLGELQDCRIREVVPLKLASKKPAAKPAKPAESSAPVDVKISEKRKPATRKNEPLDPALHPELSESAISAAIDQVNHRYLPGT